MSSFLDLKWFEDYEVQVCGKTSGGVGVCSTPIVISTDEWSKISFLESLSLVLSEPDIMDGVRVTSLLCFWRFFKTM